MRKNITGGNPHNICVIILSVLIAISIILFIVGIVIYLQPPQKIPMGPKVEKNPQPIHYRGQPVTCTNINLKKVTTNYNKNNVTLYTIDKSYQGMTYPNAITLNSGVPNRGFYNCNNYGCLTYKFMATANNYTKNQSVLNFTKKQNCIGGQGAHQIPPAGSPQNRYTYSSFILGNA